MTNKVIELAYQGHQEIVKSKALIREKVWFPRIVALVEEAIKTCAFLVRL